MEASNFKQDLPLGGPTLENDINSENLPAIIRAPHSTLDVTHGCYLTYYSKWMGVGKECMPLASSQSSSSTQSGAATAECGGCGQDCEEDWGILRRDRTEY